MGSQKMAAGDVSFLRKLAAIFTLFRFADDIDLRLLLLGTMTAVAHGLALPISMHYFGILTNVFINQFTSKQLANFEFRFEPRDFINTDRFAIVDIELVLSGFINFTNLTGGVVNCSEDFVLLPPVLNFDESLELGVTELADCLEDGPFIVEVNRYVIGFVVIAAIVLIVGTIQVFSFQVTSDRQAKVIKQRFFRSVLYQPARWFDARSSGELTSRLSNDIQRITEGMGVKLALFIQWMTTFVAGFAIGFAREWRLTLLLLAVTPFIIFTVAISYTVILVLTSKEQRQYASASSVVEEAISAIRTVVAYGGEGVETNRYDQKLQEAKKTSSYKGLTLSCSLGIIYFLIFVCYAIGFWFGAWLISQELVQAGDVLTVFFSVIIGVFSLGQAIPHLEKFVSAAGASVTIYSIIDEVEVSATSTGSVDTVLHDPFLPNSEAGRELQPRHLSIKFEGVKFAYPSRPDVNVLEGFQLSVEGGQTVALVGTSGCGKSTAIQLLMRFYEPSEGQVLLSGAGISTMSLHSLRSYYGFVGQEPVLFDTTVAENIALGKEGATQEEIVQAAKDANVHDFVVNNLPEGYNTNVGKQGTQMSGGQKQRIAIARALIRNPQILLLDDATSALDSESEQVVQSALDKASASRTTIIVSHRLSTIKSADVIVYMEKGRVVEVGTHEELMGRGGRYYNFASTQFVEVSTEEEPGSPLSPVSDNDMHDSFRSHGSSKIRHGSSKRRRGNSTRGPDGGQMKGSGELIDLEDGEEEENTNGVETELAVKNNDAVNSSWFRVWKTNSPEAFFIVVGLLGAAIQGAIYPMFAYFFGQVLRVFTLPFDQVVGAIHIWAGTFLILGFASGVATFFKNWFFSISGSRLTHRLRLSTFKSILRQEVSWFDLKENSPSLLTTYLANDAALVQGATGVQFSTLVESVVSILVAIVISLVVNQLLALLIIGFLPFLIAPGLIQFCILNAYTSHYKRLNAEAEKVAIDCMNNHQTVRALSVEERFLDIYYRKLNEAYKHSVSAGLGYGFTFAFAQAAIFIGYAITFRFGAYQSVQDINGPLFARLEAIYTVFMALIFGSLALGQSNEFAPNYTKAKHAARRVFSLIDRESAIDSYSEAGEKPAVCDGEVSLTDVFFSYPTRPGVAVMNNMTVTARAKQSTALVGPSGYGKSTVMSLLERFYDPAAGNILLDGRHIHQLNIQWLRSQMAIVFQEPVLFDRSIAENILYGSNHRQVEIEEMEQAARSANIHDFILSLPQGYDTNVGEGGALLSRGQKQRIAIARALLRDPKLLLLDEATSALDTESEREVQKALDHALKNRTSIVIAHRLSTISGADQIAVLRGGRMVEQGTHAELMEGKGLYQNMYSYQTSRNA